MADNIKIIGSILNTTTVSRYSEKDIALLQPRNLQNTFGGFNDNIEYYIYDIGENLLNISYNYLDYKLSPSNGLVPAINTTPNTTGNIEPNNVVSTYIPTSGSTIPVIEIDPVQDLQNIGYSSGEFRVQYNLFTNILSNPIDRALFVKEVSADRTEIRLASTTLTNDEIEKVANKMIDDINNSTYYVDYLLNFGNNRQYVAVNVVLNKIKEGYEVLFKLYEPLSLEIQEKDTLWIVNEKTSPYVFDINLDKLVIPPPPPTLRGPNFDIPIQEAGTVSTPYLNYQTAVNQLQSLQSSSYSQILNLLNTQSIQINVDYAVSESSDFGNFVFFGSAKSRLDNFYIKAKQIEDYTTLINKYKPLVTTTSSLQTEINLYSSSINTLISQFDGYESYLYFESSSYTWPKSGSLKPFRLLSTSSVSTSNWYATQSLLAQEYDDVNYNKLTFSIPLFISDNESNQPYLTFLDMIGQYFDNIWIYLKAITDINLANNNLNYGISKDLVYEQLKSLGIKIYNSQAGESVNQFLIGSNTGSSLWNNDFSPTSSYLNNIPRKDLVSEIYKRIYHNLPLLLKQKGTVEGLNSLMTVFGIPNKTYYTVGSESFYTPTGSSVTTSILNVKEYGGSLKSNLIKGYNSDKVRIVSNTLLTGSSLSPIASLQTYPTASSQFRDDDLHYVDISFSPQTQINTYISKSISSSNATWNIDDYIGDPRYAYSSSYGLLNAEKAKYYQVGVSGYAPFTASALDYNGFIRLIEYFDNALFKMLGDFVPERTSVSTGVTFESPVLERNKVPYAIPSAYTGSVYEGEVETVDISSDYGSFYNALTGSKKAWYDGDITGSYIDVYDYFENSNPNPYLLVNSASFTTQSIYEFQHTDFNVLLNNVSKSVDSLNRKKIEYVWGTTSSILTTPELQDSYLTLQAHNNSRYNGSKTYGLKYNTYTSASLIVDSTISNLSYTFISSSINWSDIFPPFPLGFSYTTLYLTGSISQLANIVNVLALPEVDSISISNPDPFIPDSVTSKIYKVYSYQYYDDLFTVDYTKLALALSPNLLPTGTPTIAANYGPGTLTLNLYKNYPGDYSYGKATSIDRNSYKLGWIRTVPSQSLNFYDKTTFDLKYLIDPNLQITELSANNNNLFEVQNTFKSNTPVQVSVTNVNFPSNQVKLDGTKTIFKGGFRYDPIIFRENNETLNFIFDEPISQSIEYITIRGRDDDYYFYFAEDDISAPPSNLSTTPAPLGYTYLSNDTEALSSPIASNQYGATNWAYSSSANNKINLYVPAAENPAYPSYPIPTNKIKWIYEFDLMKFETIIKNNDPNPDNFTPGGDYLYRASRTSTYNISGQIPFWFYGEERFIGPIVTNTPQQCFKAVGILEKTSDLNATWSYVAETSLNRVSTTSAGGFTFDYTASNAISFIGNSNGYFYECQLSASVQLNEGEYLRFLFYIIDLTDLFGAGTGGTGTDQAGTKRFQFQIGGGTQTKNPVNYSPSRRAFFEITDTNSPYELLYYTSSYSDTRPFFITSSNNSIETISPQAYNFFITSSTFFPTSDTQKNYTQVTDYFGFQQGDLFRFGPFKQNKPPYYTVTSVENTVRSPILLNSVIFEKVFSEPFLQFANFMAYSTSSYTPNQFSPGDIINITGTTNNNLVNAQIDRMYILGSYVYIYFKNASAYDNIVDETTPITASFTTPSLKITFDQNITNFNPISFAVLRPKPDETSVIVNYIKQPGDVSQTLLIPSDANQTLKDKTGDIFEYYNPRLNPSTQNQQN